MCEKLRGSDEVYFVICGMKTYGGSFVSSLGIALTKADEPNTQKIKQAFPEYWEQYLEMGKGIKEKKCL